MYHLLQQQSAFCIIGDFKKTKLLTLSPPDHDTNSQGFLAATQTPSGMKSEEIEDISRASMAPGEVKAIRMTEPMVILRVKGVSSMNLLIRFAEDNYPHSRNQGSN